MTRDQWPDECFHTKYPPEVLRVIIGDHDCLPPMRLEDYRGDDAYFEMTVLHVNLSTGLLCWVPADMGHFDHLADRFTPHLTSEIPQHA